MYYGNIKKNDIANGKGVRVTLFVSGCTNHCKNCFQPETWNFDYGKPYTCLLYTSPSPRDLSTSRMPSSA